MDKLEENIVTEIAKELDCGNDCYYNPKTKELIYIPNAELRATGDEEYYNEIFKDVLEKIKRQKKDFIKIGELQSFESFNIMENFKNEIKDNHFKEKLNEALNNRNPFQNFKYLIDNSDYRETWFTFKQKELEKIVIERIVRNNAST